MAEETRRMFFGALGAVVLAPLVVPAATQASVALDGRALAEHVASLVTAYIPGKPDVSGALEASLGSERIPMDYFCVHRSPHIPVRITYRGVDVTALAAGATAGPDVPGPSGRVDVRRADEHGRFTGETVSLCGEVSIEALSDWPVVPDLTAARLESWRRLEAVMGVATIAEVTVANDRNRTYARVCPWESA